MQLQCKWCQSDIDVHVTRVNTYSTAAVFHIVCTVTIICTRMHTALASSLHSHPHCTRIHTALHSHPHCTALASALRISAPAHRPQPPFHASPGPCRTRHLPRAGIEFVVDDDERMPSTSDGDYSYVIKPAGLSKTDPNPNLAWRNRSESEPGPAKPIRIRT